MSEYNDIEDWEDYENWKPLYETIDEGRSEIKRLRELLRKCKPYIAGSRSVGRTEARELFREIEKEVGDD